MGSAVLRVEYDVSTGTALSVCGVEETVAMALWWESATVDDRCDPVVESALTVVAAYLCVR